MRSGANQFTTQTQTTDYGQGGRGRKEKMRCSERATWKLTLPYVK